VAIIAPQPALIGDLRSVSLERFRPKSTHAAVLFYISPFLPHHPCADLISLPARLVQSAMAPCQDSGFVSQHFYLPTLNAICPRSPLS